MFFTRKMWLAAVSFSGNRTVLWLSLLRDNFVISSRGLFFLGKTDKKSDAELVKEMCVSHLFHPTVSSV